MTVKLLSAITALVTTAAAAPPAAARVVTGPATVREALSRGDLRGAERLLAQVPAGDPGVPELSWLVAHASHQPQRIAAAAQRWCPHDPTGRACADAELFGAVRNAPAVDLTSESDIPLSTTAPFPLMLARAGATETAFIVDTGASQTVVSSRLAKTLGLHVTKASFPVATSAGAVSAHLALLPVLSGAGFIARDLPVLVMDLPDLDAIGISGIVSPQQAFDGLTVRIDLAQHVLRLSRARVARHAVTHGVVVPYVTSGFDLAIEARIGDGPLALFGVDTGMEGGYVVAADYHPSAGGSEGVLHGASGAAVVPLVAASPVSIAGVSLDPSGDCAVIPLAKADGGKPLSGMLGNGVWRSGTLTIDTVARLIRIDVPPRAASPAAAPVTAPVPPSTVEATVVQPRT